MSETIGTILVTGATGGIGAPLCARLAEAGHTLVLGARGKDRLVSLAASLPKPRGAPHRAIAVDMADDASIDAFAAALADGETVLDGVVLMPPQIPPTAESLPANAVWTTIFQGSFIGPLAVLKAAIATMRPDPAAGRRAKIVIVSGISSAQVLGHYATSNVLRCAWVGQAKTLAFALGDRGIHVNTLSLGGTLTPDYTSGLARRAERAGATFEARLAEETANIPLRKYGRPAEVAVAIEGLLSSFSDHMTGLNILHDGGFTRAY